MPIASLGAVVGLLCTGCPSGSSLDAPAQQYIQPAQAAASTTGAMASTTGDPTTTGVGGMAGAVTTGAVATTGAPAGCTDADVSQIFLTNCSTSSCHGNPGMPPTGTMTSLHLFPADLRASFVGIPGARCTTEQLIDPANPPASLIINVLKQTAQCGVAMPSTFLKLPEADIACVESWVNGVVATQ